MHFAHFKGGFLISWLWWRAQNLCQSHMYVLQVSFCSSVSLIVEMPMWNAQSLCPRTEAAVHPLPSCCSGPSRGEEHALITSDPLLCLSSPELLQQCAEDRQICPSLAGFQFTKWDSETHNEVWSVFGLFRARGISPALCGFSEMVWD